MRRQSGFTLIELATTAAIAVILAGVATPALGGFIERQRAAATTSALMAKISLARLSAVTHHRHTVLCASASGSDCDQGSRDWSGGWMLFFDDNGNRRRDVGEEVLRVEQAGGGPLRVVTTRGRPQLRYQPDGSSAGSNLTISICSPRGTVLGTVVVNNMGRPRSERPRTERTCPA